MRENGLLRRSRKAVFRDPSPHPLGAGINCLRSAKIDLSSSARTSGGTSNAGTRTKGGALSKRGDQYARSYSDRPTRIPDRSYRQTAIRYVLMAEDVEKCSSNSRGASIGSGSPFALGSCSCVYGTSVGAAEAPSKRRPGPNRSMAWQPVRRQQEGVQGLVAVGRWLVCNGQAKPVPVRARR